MRELPRSRGTAADVHGRHPQKYAKWNARANIPAIAGDQHEGSIAESVAAEAVIIFMVRINRPRLIGRNQGRPPGLGG